MNNIEKILNFIEKKTLTPILVNQVTDEIGFFYVNLIKSELAKKNKKLIFEYDLFETLANDLFEEDNRKIYFSNSKKNIDRALNSKTNYIIFTDYKNYKIFSKAVLCINGYDYQKDIKFYVKEKLKIDNSEIVDFCINSPYLAFSEISKYLINSFDYKKENKIKFSDNFILAIRKDLFNYRRDGKSPLEIYKKLKQEVIYKKFNFLTC